MLKRLFNVTLIILILFGSIYGTQVAFSQEKSSCYTYGNQLETLQKFAEDNKVAAKVWLYHLAENPEYTGDKTQSVTYVIFENQRDVVNIAYFKDGCAFQLFGLWTNKVKMNSIIKPRLTDDRLIYFVDKRVNGQKI